MRGTITRTGFAFQQLVVLLGLKSVSPILGVLEKHGTTLAFGDTDGTNAAVIEAWRTQTVVFLLSYGSSRTFFEAASAEPMNGESES